MIYCVPLGNLGSFLLLFLHLIPLSLFVSLSVSLFLQSHSVVQG